MARSIRSSLKPVAPFLCAYKRLSETTRIPDPVLCVGVAEDGRVRR